jgi:hypothetical protein
MPTSRSTPLRPPSPLRRRLPLVLLPLVLALGGCDEDDLLGPNDPALEPLVGEWRATSFRVEPTAAPALGFDVIEEGGRFGLDIEPSGRYAAVLEFNGLVSTELGTITVSGSELIQTPTDPPGDPTTVNWELIDDDQLILTGESEFDFNQDGFPEPASIRIDLDRVTP